MAFRIQIFVGLGALITMALFQISNYLDPPYAVDKFRMRQLLNKKDNIEALAIGNSHNLAIDFETLGLDGYHIWQGGNDVFETWHQVKVVTPRLKNLKLVLFAVSYFTFRYDNAANPEVDTSDLRRSFYAAMPSFNYIDGDLRNYLLALASPIIRQDHWRGAFTALAHGRARDGVVSLSERFEIDEWGKPTCPENFTFMAQDSLIRQTKGPEIPHNLRRVKTMTANHPGLARDAYSTIVAIATYLQRRGVRVVFYTPPFFSLYTEIYDPNIVREMRGLMQQLRTETGVEYYDFSEDSAFTSNNKIFRDDDHLNAAGAKLFSTKLKELILIRP